MIRTASVAPPKSPMNLAQGDEVPQIITRRTRQRRSEFLTPLAKRLLQHNPPEADSSTKLIFDQRTSGARFRIISLGKNGQIHLDSAFAPRAAYAHRFYRSLRLCR